MGSDVEVNGEAAGLERAMRLTAEAEVGEEQSAVQGASERMEKVAAAAVEVTKAGADREEVGVAEAGCARFGAVARPSSLDSTSVPFFRVA